MATKLLQIAVPFIWFGTLAAISFMETPLKFRAPGITLPLGLGIGKIMFFYLNKIELVLACLFLISVIFKRPNKPAVAAFVTVASLLLVQTLWLLPALDVRTQQVIAGTAEPFSNLHIYYIVFDAVKVLSLLTLGILTANEHLTSNEERNA
jgi:hypothetical protein